MALKALMLRKKITDKKKILEALRARDEEFMTREAELEQSINEAETDEEHAAVEEAVDAYEAEKKDHEDKEQALEAEIAGLETELAETEAEQERTAPTPEEKANKPEAEPASEEHKEERGTIRTMNKAIMKMSAAERTALVAHEGVHAWLGEIRTAIKEKRAITNVGLTIPEVMLPLLRENIENWSKLYDKVTVRQINGVGRQPIMGTIPEAIWTECCANLNELSLAFADWELDCFKVGGYFAICNANLEDSDIDLLAELVEALGQAIGKALDKAILYGRNTSTNSKMPLGVVTRLAQTASPTGYPATARTWVDLHTSNIKAVGTTTSPVTGTALITELVKASAAAATDYSRGELTWLMNDKTYKNVVANVLEVNSAGAVVAGLSDRMPVVGGAIEVLNFIPDNVIVYGYFDAYLLGERAGREFASSEHVRFLQDQTVIKGTARYDGAPIIAEAFGAIALNGATVVATAVTFAADTANSSN